MAMAIASRNNSRFTDIFDEPVDRLLLPIKGYESNPLLSLTETIRPISNFFNEIKDYVYVALHNCQNPADGLTQQESASIHLYTMQFQGGPSLYHLLNQSLRAENRDELKPWFSFLKLFLTALHKLPSHNERVWRGVKDVDLSSIYKTGTKFAWWGVSSCTTHIQVLESNQFLGKNGLRTLFSIDCISGKSIENHSYFKNKEKEIILMPGSYFEVIGQLNPASQLHIIQLKEILPPIKFLKPPFSTTTDTNPSSIVNRSNIYPEPTSNMMWPRITSNVVSRENPMNSNTKRKQFGIIIAGGNGYGNKLNQFALPHGIFVDDDQTVYVADSENHRIVEWKSNATNGRIVAGGLGQGNQMNQLYWPTALILDRGNNSLIISDTGNRRVLRWSHENNTRNGEIIISNIDCFGLTMDKNGSLYLADWKKDEVVRWKKGEKYGITVAGGNGKGDHLNQLNAPSYIFVDEMYSLYVSDYNNHRIMKWMRGAKEGIIVAGGNGPGNSLTQLSLPQGVVVDPFGDIYVADWGNYRVMRWCCGAKQGTIIIGRNEKESNQFCNPRSLSFDQERNLYISDCNKYRIQKFEME